MNQSPTVPKATRGTALSCKGWPQEAALRLFLNNNDPEVATPPDSGTGSRDGKSAPALDETLSLIPSLRELPDDQTLFVHSDAGTITGAHRTGTKDAPSVVIAFANEQVAPYSEHSQGNLHTFSQIAAASWFYAGSQGALQAQYETLAAAARQNFGATLAGKLVVACGLGAVGGAQLLAATLHGAAALGIEPDAERIKQRVKSGYCEIMVNDLDEALRILKNSVRRREPASVALVGDCNKLIPELARRGIVPDLLLPNFRERSLSAEDETPGIAELRNLGATLLDGETFPTDLAADRSPVTCIAFSGSPTDITRADRLLRELFPASGPLQQWLPLAQRHVRFQGLPARIVWLTPAEQLQFSLALNNLVERAELQAPVAIGHMELHPSPILQAADVKPPMPLAACSEVQIELVAKAASAEASGAFLTAVDLLDPTVAVASAILADGTSATRERITRALNNEAPEEGHANAL